MAASELPSLSVRRPVLAVVINLLIVIAGMAALMGVEVRELPDIDRPVVTVRAFWDGAAPETMDAEVTSVIEGAVARVSGAETIESASEENNARIRVTFSPAVDVIDAANDVREAVASIERQLPEGVEDLTVVKADDDSDPIIRLAVASGRLSAEALTRLAEDDISTELAGIPGVAAVQLFGNRKRVLRVVVDPLRLAAYGLSVDDIASTLRTVDLDVPAGSFKSADQLLLVRADASVWRTNELEELELAEDIRLGDVAQAFYGPADAESYVRLDGRRVIGLGVVRRAQSNTIAISEAVDKAIERLNRRLDDVSITKMSDDARFIEGAVTEVAKSLGIAIVVVFAVILLFLGAIRPTLIPATAIPIALIGTVAAIWLLGFSVNILTLLALVLATGLIVDDAIVVLENIQRQRGLGLKPLAAAVIGTRQVFFAVLATTATLISVFLPIAFLPSAAGRLFTEFGFVLAIAVGISSFVALSMCPLLASRLPAVDDSRPRSPGPLARLGAWCARLYGRLLDAMLAARALTLTIAIGLATLAGLGFGAIDQELLPKEDRGLIMVMMQGPDGVGLEYMDRQAVQAEAILEPYRQSGEIRTIMTIVGRWDLNRVFIIAPLADWSERSRTQQEIEKELRGPLSQIPGSSVRLRSGNSLGLRGSSGGVEIALTGPTHPEIAGAIYPFLDAIRERLPQLDDLRLSYQPTQPQLSIAVDRRRAEDLGVSVNSIEATLRAMVDGFEVAELNVGDRAVPVLLESAAGAIDDPGDLENLFVSSRNGDLVPLSSFVSLSESGVAAELDRAGQKRAIEIDARPLPSYPLGQAVADLEVLAEETLPSNIGILFLGDAASLSETSSQVAITFGIAVLIVFLVLAAQFESLLSAATIVLTVPFGIAAAVFALLLSGTSINVYSQIGLVMLVGLMAKNGILVVEFADQLRDRGRSVREAVREAATVRLRPVMMTMLSTVLSAVPLIVGGGAGAEARNAIGWIVFGGLGMATLFTLFLIPLVYSLLAPLAPARAHAGVQLDRELREAEGIEDPESDAATTPPPISARPLAAE